MTRTFDRNSYQAYLSARDATEHTMSVYHFMSEGRGEDARYSLLRAREELVQALDKLSVIQRLIEESDNVFDLNVDAEEGVA